MISISSLAQRFRPRPAVLPAAQPFLVGGAATPQLQQQQQHQQQQQQHQLQQLQQQQQPSMTSASMFTPVGFQLSTLTGGQASQPDSPDLVGDPILSSSLSSLTRFGSQDTNFGSYPMHVLTPIVSLLSDSPRNRVSDWFSW